MLFRSHNYRVIQPVPLFDLALCLDAKRGKLYSRSYRYHGKRWRPTSPARVLLSGEMVSHLSQGSWVAGDGLLKIDRKGLVTVPEKNWLPQATTLIRLFETKDPLLKKLTRPKEFLPVYLRHSEPEEKLKEKKQHHGE